MIMAIAVQCATDFEPVTDSRARRAARRAGLVARKSRWRADSIDNHGEYMLLESTTNNVVAGPRFNMTANEVVEFCEHDTNRPFRIAAR
jgi:hypothetical protein